MTKPVSNLDSAPTSNLRPPSSSSPTSDLGLPTSNSGLKSPLGRTAPEASGPGFRPAGNSTGVPTSDLRPPSPVSGVRSTPPESGHRTSPLDQRCSYSDAAGRRCRTPRCDSHPSLCQNHARGELLKFQNHQNFAPELLGPIENFQTASAVNHALGRLFVLLGANRIHTRQAAVLAYICQLMLQSLDGVKDEVRDVIDSDFTEKELYRVIDSLPALDPKLATPRGANGKP